jgi:hypothetical protein
MTEGIHIQLENSSNEILKDFLENFAIIYVYFTEEPETGERYPLIGSIKESGETVFDSKQIAQFITELKGLNEEFQDNEVSPVIERIVYNLKDVKIGDQLRFIAK